MCSRCESSGRHTMLLSQPSARTRAVEVSQKTRGPRAPLPPRCEYPFAGRTPSAPESSREVDVRSPNKHRARRRPTRVARVHSITLSIKKCPRSAPTLSTPRVPYLSCACFSHQCRQLSGGDIARDIIEKPPYFSP